MTRVLLSLKETRHQCTFCLVISQQNQALISLLFICLGRTVWTELGSPTFASALNSSDIFEMTILEPSARLLPSSADMFRV